MTDGPEYAVLMPVPWVHLYIFKAPGWGESVNFGGSDAGDSDFCHRPPKTLFKTGVAQTSRAERSESYAETSSCPTFLRALGVTDICVSDAPGAPLRKNSVGPVHKEGCSKSQVKDAKVE